MNESKNKATLLMPALLLDKEKCLRNMEKMARKAADHGLILRPHCKTHQSAEIANWLRDFEIGSITVSSFPMARYFAAHGWKDILVAFPFHPGETENLQELSARCKLSILIDSPAALPFLNHIPNPVSYYVDIDTGYGRTGVRSENPELIEQIVVKAGSNKNLEFSGFYCHAGHSYKTANRDEMNNIHLKALDDLAQLKSEFGQYGPTILYGDTPNCSVQDDFGKIDELTPGNFIFYDLFQHRLGSCDHDDIAVAMECHVAGRYPAGDRIVIHGGAVHFSKEFLQVNGRPVFGRLAHKSGMGWAEDDREIYLDSISQEHGVLENCGALLQEVHIGESLLFLPVHSCLTANLSREYITTGGERIPNMHAG